jgi:hypothetical protein
MALSGQERHPVRNRLLADLPPEEEAQLRPHLERVSLGVKEGSSSNGMKFRGKLSVYKGVMSVGLP